MLKLRPSPNAQSIICRFLPIHYAQLPTLTNQEFHSTATAAMSTLLMSKPNTSASVICQRCVATWICTFSLFLMESRAYQKYSVTLPFQIPTVLSKKSMTFLCELMNNGQQPQPHQHRLALMLSLALPYQRRSLLPHPHAVAQNYLC